MNLRRTRQRRPAHDTPPGARWPTARARCARAARWLARRRHVAADQFLRGACYGAGTTVVGLLTVWAQTR